MDQINKNLRELINELNRLTVLYDNGKPEVTDAEWDILYLNLKDREKETGIIYPDSPTQKIHFETVSALEKKEHNHLMLSLDKTKEVKEVENFVRGHEWYGMFKMDGLTCSLSYNRNGDLVRAETRGNGIIGEDILHNALIIPSIPKHIPCNEPVIIDGEIICDWITFNMHFAEEYANPRNFAAGAIRRLNSAETAQAQLTFVAWDLVKGCENIDFNFWRLEKLDEWGFITVPRVGDAETIEDAITILDKMKNGEDSYSNSPYMTYPIDGYVFKFESKKYGESLGRTEHHFKNAIAYKFYDEEYQTELLDIEYTMGRTGVLTPVAIFKPIDTGDSIIERASLHNLSVMRDLLGTYPEYKQKIWVIKANMIIPQVTRAIRNDEPNDHIIIDDATCPICGEPAKIVESDSGVLNLVCVNENCEGKLLNRIDHYCSKKGLDIKGLSKKTIEKLIDWGWLNSIFDLFTLRIYQKEWINKNGFGEASVLKILNNIDAAKNCRLDQFIVGLGIPLVGTTIAKEIVKYYNTWEDFRNATNGDWTEFEGFGPEISRSINNFDYTEADKIAAILNFKQTEVQNEEPAAAAIKDKVFVITGKVTHFKNRDELKTEIESLGGKVTGSVSSKTDYLINNDINSTTGKNKKAKELGIPIISEDDYLKMKS